MGWSQPFLDLFLSRTSGLRAGFAAASAEITTIIACLDDLAEQQAASPTVQDQKLRKLKRSIRDVHWRAFDDLELTQASKRRSRLRELRERFHACVTRISQSVNAPTDLLAVGADDRIVEELLELRRQLGDEERLLLARWSAFTTGIRYTVMFGTAAGTAFLVLYSGLVVQQFEPLAPTPEYELIGGVFRLRDAARDAITTRYSEYLSQNLQQISSLPSRLVGDAGDSTRTPFQTPRTVESLFEHVCAFKLLNRSYVQSEYVGILTSRIRLVKREPFPWRDVFPQGDPPRVRFEPTDGSHSIEWYPMGSLINDGNAPVLVELTMKVNGEAIVTIRDRVLRTSDPLHPILDFDWESAGPTTALPELQPTMPENAVIPSLPEGLVSPTVPSPPEGFDSPPEIKDRLEAGTLVQVEWTYETLDGQRIEEHSTFELPVSLVRLRNPRSLSPGQLTSGSGIGVVAALMGKATTVGEHTIRVDLPLDVEGMREGEVRTTTMPIDQYLKGRGYLSIYSQFTPTVGGVYELVVEIDGRTFDGQRIAAMCPEVDVSGTLTAGKFRLIQQRFKEGITKGNPEEE